MESRGCFINGGWVSTTERLAVMSPWSGETVGEVSLAGPGEWEAAITAAPKVAATLSRIYSQERRGMLEAMVAGVEASGLGREGVRQAMEELTNIRFVALKV